MDKQNFLGNISVIIPVYNEAGVIEDVLRGFYDNVVKKIPDAKFIIKEDGSTDGTKEILSRLVQEMPFTLISEKNRRGYARAFRDALSLAKTELIFFSDSDGQHDPVDFFRLLKEIDRADIVSGYKFPRRDPFYRIVISKVYNFLIYLLFGLKIRDINSGFKLIKKKVIDRVLSEVKTFKYCVMSEFILRAYLMGYKIKEVPVNHCPRRIGKTSIFIPSKLPLIILGLIRSLFTIKFSHIKNKTK